MTYGRFELDAHCQPLWAAGPGGVIIEEAGTQVRLTPFDEETIRISARADATVSWKPSDLVVGTPSRLEFDIVDLGDRLRLSLPRVAAEYVFASKSLGFMDSKGALLTTVVAPEPRLTPTTVYRPLRNGDAKVSTIHTSDGEKSVAASSERSVDRSAYSVRIDFVWQDDESLYGLGQHDEGALDLRGTTQELYQQNTKVSVPFLLSSRGYGVLVDCSSRMRFSDSENGRYLWGAVADQLDWYFIAGGDLDGVVRGYRRLSGRVPLPPRSLLGYVQSRERYETQAQVLEIQREFERREIPLDVMLLDWQTWPKGQWGQKSFDPDAFPDPAEMVRTLHDGGVRLMVSVWPNFTGDGADQKEMRAAGHLLGDDSVYNAYSPEARELYFRQLWSGLGRFGVDDWWTDCSEPYSADWEGAMEKSVAERAILNTEESERFIDAGHINAYSLRHAQGLAEHHRANSERRMTILSRSGFVGQQRFGAIVWSGDTSATWDELRRQIPMGLNFMATGTPYWTFDIGGFFTATRPDQWFWRGGYDAGVDDPDYRELYVRWLQVGAFSPVMRSHGTDTPREPWHFGERGSPHYDAIVTSIRLRKTLQPFLYSLADRVTNHDDSMVRMLAFGFPDQRRARITDDEFLVGDELLVAPVLEPHARTRSVWLPAGVSWYALSDGTRFDGGQAIDVPVTLNSIPVFVKQGSILPTRGDDGAWVLTVYPGADGESSLYHDDGETRAYERGDFWRATVRWDNTRESLTLSSPMGTHVGPSFAGAYNASTGETLLIFRG